MAIANASRAKNINNTQRDRQTVNVKIVDKTEMCRYVVHYPLCKKRTLKNIYT